jgi:hypothetical protein
MKNLISLFFIIVVGFSYQAYCAVGELAQLTGIVVDAKTGERLTGVSVSVEGTKKGAKTNVNGQFTLRVDPGSYSFKVSYIGYQTKLISNTDLRAGETRTMEIALEQKHVEGQEVVVTSKMESETQTAQLLARKKAATMNDVLGAEQIKRSPDATSGDAIKRISGVTIADNKFVQIRGTSERYNNALLNGTALTSTEPDKKAFSFDLLPANLIDNAIVSKTFTPDLPANFSGGLVQVNTINFPAAFNAKISIGSGFNSTTTGGDFITYQTGGGDWLGYDDGTRGMPAGFPTTNIRGDQAITTGKLTEYSKLFKNTWSPRTTTAGPSTNFSVSVGDAVQVFDESELGYIGSFSYRSGFEHTDIVRNSYNLNSSEPVAAERSGVRDVRSITLGGLANLTYKFSPSHIVSFKNIYNQTADDQVIQLAGYDASSTFDDKQTSFRYMERSLYSGQLVGEHVFEDLAKARLDWRLALSTSKREEPDLRRYVYFRQHDDETQPYRMAISGGANPFYGGRFFSEMNEASHEGAMDITLPALDGKIKVGGLLNSRVRDFSARVLAMTLANPMNQGLTLLSPDSIFATENIGPQGFLLDELTDGSDRYDASENVGALYGMLDIPFSEQVRFIGGARYERSAQRLNSMYKGGGDVHYGRVANDILPAIGFVYMIDEQVNLRVAATQTVARPEFREIAPFAFYDFEINSIIQGDTSIERSLIRNLDFRAEYYPTAGELVSLSVFHKQFGMNGFFDFNDTADVSGGAIEATNEGSNSIRSWENAKKPAVNYGLELEVRKNLGFIDDMFSNFIISGNYSYIISKVNVKELSQGQQESRPMQGQSPYTLNLGLLYSHPSWGTSVNLLYNTYGKRIAEVNAEKGDVYEFPRNVIDLTISQNLFEQFELKFSIKDLLAEPQYFAGENFDANSAASYDVFKPAEGQLQNLYERSNRKGTSYSLSLSIKL